MIDCGSLDYANARVHARHGRRLDGATWRRIEVTRDFGPMLEVARSSTLRPWLVGITVDSGAHEVEAVLRRHWRALVAEVTGWLPASWQPALAWCAWLPDLPALQHLARGGEPAAWMQDDDRWQALCEAEAPQRAAVLAESPAAALAGAWAAPATFGPVWFAAWQRRLPQPVEATGDPLGQVVRALLDHGRLFADAAPSQGWALRGDLQARLALLLRRCALGPAAAFIHVALCALDLERLRAELLRRVLFRRWKVA